MAVGGFDLAAIVHSIYGYPIGDVLSPGLGGALIQGSDMQALNQPFPELV